MSLHRFSSEQQELLDTLYYYTHVPSHLLDSRLNSKHVGVIGILHAQLTTFYDDNEREILNEDKYDEYKDLNRCICVNCGNKHNTHDRVSTSIVQDLIDASNTVHKNMRHGVGNSIHIGLSKIKEMAEERNITPDEMIEQLKLYFGTKKTDNE